MIFRESDIKRHYELAFCTLKDRRRQLQAQKARVRELCSEIDRRSDTGLSNHHQMEVLINATKRLEGLKQNYARSLKACRKWRDRYALFNQFKAEYAAAGYGGAS